MHKKRLPAILALSLSAASFGLAAAPSDARAFCGFYVAGADQKLFNNATMVVMMRDGTRTVLSMQNNYQGPPQNFAMVVPVPVVLQQENVKTLPREIFDRVDKLAAPRLVEYWEVDPCEAGARGRQSRAPGGAPRPMSAAKAAPAAELGVTIEAQFTVGEYEVVILSATDSAGLEIWLKQNNYKIPDGAEPLLKPYVQAGSKFFVAKVDTSKVQFKDGMAMLSPLRFHYDTDSFQLPVRLGLVNSSGTQDLIVHILAKQKRYEVANYKNVTIPTNLDVDEQARDQFGAFYAALFDRTLEENPGSVITEYSWDASSCDPCPSPALSPAELLTLGADVLPSAEKNEDDVAPPPPMPPGGMTPSKPGPAPGGAARPRVWNRGNLQSFVLTRLHARYGKNSLGEDLVFREAPAIAGGREFRGAGGKLEKGSSNQGSVNNFQGRYAIRHPWTGPIKCDNPVRGIWGGPPHTDDVSPGAKAAQNLAFAPRGKIALASFVKEDVPEIKIQSTSKLGDPKPSPLPGPQEIKSPGSSSTGCGACEVGRPNSSDSSGYIMHSISIALLSVLRVLKRGRRSSPESR